MQAYLTKSPLWADVESIFTSDTKIPVYQYLGQLHTTELDIQVMHISTIDFRRDYVNNIGDEIVIQFSMMLGDYMMDVYPNRHNMEFTLQRIPITGDGYAIDTESPRVFERYKAVFIPDQNPHMNLKSFNTIDRFTLNNQAPVTVTLQLLNRTLEPLRIKTVQGTYSDVNRKELVTGLLGGETMKIQIDGKPGLDSFDMVEPNNKDPIKQIIIPNHTPVLAIPTFVHERHTGIYTAGIGNYFQTYNNLRTWFVYPLYDTTRFNTKGPKLIIYAVPSQQYAGMDRTYKIDDTTVHVVATSDQQYIDDGESSQMLSGVGFRQTNADELMGKPVEMTPDGPIGDRGRINTEVGLKEREDGLNYAVRSTRSISMNNFAEYSQHLINNGARLNITWHNSDPSLLYPGMPCKYVYMTDEEVKEVKGIVLFNHTLITTGTRHAGIKMTDRTYSVNTHMVIFTERFTDAK